MDKPADITLLILDIEKEIDPEDFASKGKNTPFWGWSCKGWPIATFVDGDLKWTEGVKHSEAQIDIGRWHDFDWRSVWRYKRDDG